MKAEKMLFELMKKGIVRKVDVDNYDFVDQVFSLTKAKALEKFIQDAVIPFRIKAFDGRFFYANKTSADGVKFFQEILFGGEYAYVDMVRVTKDFYANEKNNRMGLTSFLRDGVLKGLLQEDRDGTDINYEKTNKVHL